MTSIGTILIKVGIAFTLITPIVFFFWNMDVSLF